MNPTDAILPCRLMLGCHYVGVNNADRLDTDTLFFRSGCLAVHRLLTVYHLIKVSIILRVKFRVRARDMVKLKLMDQGDVTVRIRVRIS